MYLIHLSEEKLGSGLSEIKTAQDISRQMIYNAKYQDLLSVATMSGYFEKYYKEQGGELDYNVNDDGVRSDLIDLLSLNKNRWLMKNNGYSIRAQAFKTAGEKFRLIDECTVSVIVPYNEDAKEIISRLRSGRQGDELTAFLRKAQKYTVGLYDNIVRKLKTEGALDKLDCDVYCLDDRYYDMRSGVILEGKPMDLLLY